MATDSLRSITKTIIIDQILPHIEDPQLLLEHVNGKNNHFLKLKICRGLVTREKKVVICGKDTTNKSAYCTLCAKKVANKSLTLNMSQIGNEEDHLYWCQKNDHIYRFNPNGSTLTLEGVRVGWEIVTDVPDEVLDICKSLNINTV